MDEGTFVEWLKHDGDAVRPGDPLFVLESEKAAEPIEALDAGILRIAPDGPQMGAKVKVGEVLAYIAAADEDFRPSRDREGAATPTPLPHGRGSETPATAASPAAPRPHLRHAASPRARRVARELGIDTSTIQGTGAAGRIRERDVRANVPAGRFLPHTPARRQIAARMVAAVTQAAPVTLTTRVDASELIALRDRCQGAGFVPSYTCLLVKVAAMALRQHPLLQAQWRDDGLFIPDAVDIAVAVDTEAGLFAPVLRGADRLSLGELAVQLADLIALARAGRLSAEQMRDATFTVTNLGMFGIDVFTPIIRLPQSAVLGVGRIVREPVVMDDRIEPRPRMTLCLTFDHRVMDGAPAARFLDAVRHAIEQPPRDLSP
jgi:pyruvate dehydrogenase E2 component (dihydrolipoamide acetyltransferase)